MTVRANKQEWEALTPDQQQQISAIISDNFDGQTVAVADSRDLAADLGNACTIACDVAEAAAVVACQALPFGQSICIGLAKQAGNACRSLC